MAKMNWVKPSPETISYFERITPGPPIEARRMFGMPARFLNGHLLVGVFGDTFMLHLSAEDRAACIAAGAKPFAPMGREAKEYVDVAPGTFDDRTLKEWIVRGMRYLGKLPPKLARPRSEAPKSKAKPASRATSASKPAPPSRRAGTTTRSRSARQAGKAASPSGAKRGRSQPAPKRAATAATKRGKQAITKAPRKKTAARAVGRTQPPKRSTQPGAQKRRSSATRGRTTAAKRGAASKKRRGS